MLIDSLRMFDTISSSLTGKTARFPMFYWILILFVIPVDSLAHPEFPGRILIDRSRLNIVRIFPSHISVLLNLMDISQMIDQGWRPVIDRNNTTLTESTLSSLDLLDVPITNLTSFALRTPLSTSKSSPIPIQVLTPSNTNSGKIRSIDDDDAIILASPSFDQSAPVLPVTFILTLIYRSAQNSSGTLFTLLSNDRSPILLLKLNTNITLTYHYERQTEELHFHRTNFIANDGK